MQGTAVTFGKIKEHLHLCIITSVLYDSIIIVIPTKLKKSKFGI